MRVTMPRPETILRTSALLVSLPVNMVLGIAASFCALSLYDEFVGHYSPAMPLPAWRALPYLALTYIAAGGLAAAWSRGWWSIFIPFLLGYFFALGGYQFGAQYYSQSLWDELGRPTGQEATIGAICAICSVMGWAAIGGVARWARGRLLNLKTGAVFGPPR